MYPLDLWIKQDTDINEVKKVFYSRWEPAWGGLRVNVVVSDKLSLSKIDSLLNLLRSTKVGAEGRHPHIGLWFDINKLTVEFIEYVKKVDRFIPRIKLYMLKVDFDDFSQKETNFIDNLNDNRLDWRVLCAFFGQNHYNSNAINFIEKLSCLKLLHNTIFEYFPKNTIVDKNEFLYSLLRQLKKKNYHFSDHPLFLCGAIAYTCKKIFLNCFCKQSNTEFEGEDNIDFNIGSLFCVHDALSNDNYTSTVATVIFRQNFLDIALKKSSFSDN